MKRITPLSIRECYVNTLANSSSVKIQHRNAKLHIRDLTDGDYRWECGCGARGHDTPDALSSAKKAITHVERVHPEFVAPRPLHTRTREDPVSVPNNSDDAHPTDDAQSHDRDDEQRSLRSLIDILIDESQPLSTFRFIQNRWELFTSEELGIIDRCLSNGGRLPRLSSWHETRERLNNELALHRK